MSGNMSVGILAYGSVIDDPREEIKAALVKTLDSVLTPFHVEYARASNSRAGAPTLVPVSTGGAQVRGSILIVNASEADAADMLYRRETNQVGSGKKYTRPANPGPVSVLIDKVDGALAGVDTVLYTSIAPTITPLTAETLAKLAIESAKKLTNGRDGITYLMNAKKSGIKTLLSDDYERAILRRLDVRDLREALTKIRAA